MLDEIFKSIPAEFYSHATGFGGIPSSAACVTSTDAVLLYGHGEHPCLMITKLNNNEKGFSPPPPEDYFQAIFHRDPFSSLHFYSGYPEPCLLFYFQV